MSSLQAEIPALPVADSGTSRRPKVTIRPARGWELPDLSELWSYRDLLWILAGRDVKLRYKQTALGVIWVVLQPLLPALIFALIFGRFAKLPSDGSSYLLFAYAGLVPWSYFSNGLVRAGNSLLADRNLISKVYFPRLLIPVASTFAVLIDLFVALAVLAAFMVVYRVMPDWHIVALPFFLLLATLATVGFSLWLSALNVRYRDFAYALPFVVQVWMFASPVAYATELVPGHIRWLYGLNPAVGFIEGFRWSLLGRSSISPEIVAAMTITSLLAFVSGILFFGCVERGFADVV